MDCSEAALKSQELLDGALSDEAARRVRSHLASCGGCGRVFRGLAAAVQVLSSLPVYSLGPEARARILAIWVAHRRRETGRMWISAAVFALVCCSLALAIWVLDAALNASDGQTVFNLLLDPERVQITLRLALMRWGLIAGQWWSVAEAWLGPLAVGFKGGTLLTLILFTGTAVVFLMIELFSRLRSAPRLGEYQ